MGIGMSSAQTHSNTQGRLQEEGRRKVSWWREKLLAEDLALATPQCKEAMLGASQLVSSSAGGGWQEGGDNLQQYRLSCTLRHSPAQPKELLSTSDSK